MKLVKTSNGKSTIKMSKSDWKSIGKQASWIKESQESPSEEPKKSKGMSLSEYVKSRIDNPNFYVNDVNIASEKKFSNPSWNVVYVTSTTPPKNRFDSLYYELSSKDILGEGDINWGNVDEWIAGINRLSEEELKAIGRSNVAETWHFSPSKAREIWWKNSKDPESNIRYEKWKEEDDKRNEKGRDELHNPVGPTWGT